MDLLNKKFEVDSEMLDAAVTLMVLRYGPDWRTMYDMTQELSREFENQFADKNSSRKPCMNQSSVNQLYQDTPEVDQQAKTKTPSPRLRLIYRKPEPDNAPAPKRRKVEINYTISAANNDLEISDPSSNTVSRRRISVGRKSRKSADPSPKTKTQEKKRSGDRRNSSASSITHPLIPCPSHKRKAAKNGSFQNGSGGTAAQAGSSSEETATSNALSSQSAPRKLKLILRLNNKQFDSGTSRDAPEVATAIENPAPENTAQHVQPAANGDSTSRNTAAANANSSTVQATTDFVQPAANANPNADNAVSNGQVTTSVSTMIGKTRRLGGQQEDQFLSQMLRKIQGDPSQ